MNEEEKKKIPRLIKWALGIKQGPVRIDLILTNKCNQKCGYCYLREHESSTEDELTTEEIVKVVKGAASLGVYNWNLMGGGEPMFDQNKALTATKEIKKNNMFGNITTNGTLFNQKIIDELVRIGWDCINFSIDSAEEETQDSLRGHKGSLKKAEEALKLFKQTKDSMKKTKPTIVIHSVLTKKNYNKLKRLIIFAKENGADKLELTQVMSFSKIAKGLRLNQEELEEFKKNMSDLVTFSKKIGLNTNLEEYTQGNLIQESENMDGLIKREVNFHQIKTPCFNPWTSLMILNNGDVGPCCLYTPDKKIGNIRESSLKEIWLSKELEEFRNKIKNNKLDSCKDCPSTEVIRNKEIRDELEKSFILKVSDFIKNLKK